jgi:hypothetical protein
VWWYLVQVCAFATITQFTFPVAALNQFRFQFHKPLFRSKVKVAAEQRDEL